ncbi:MAG: transcription antitermination factor NusB [Chloroflexota bacterium]|nr:transcription antitermination factor NusB [Chloroflexota bacterium]
MPEVLIRDPRSLARTVALQAGFASDLRGGFDEESGVEWLLEENLVGARDADNVLTLSRALLAGLNGKQQELDDLIQTYAPAWPVHLLSPVDRNILRIALYELLYHPVTPAKTAVNEAVELAKMFGSDSSARFVNGVLGTAMSALPRGELNKEKLASEGR